MTSLTNAQIKVLQAAPIGMDDDSNGDPQRGGRHRYQGADGRVARALWLRGLLEYDAVDPRDARAGGLLKLSKMGRLALEAANSNSTTQSSMGRRQ